MVRLRRPYAISGTEIGYATTIRHAMSGSDIVYAGTPYAMSGTKPCYAATRLLGPGLRSSRTPRYLLSPFSLRAPYAMPGTAES
eukprot:1696934-Rhodomonas_salina.1